VIGFDTNVLARAMLQEEKAKAGRAQARLAAEVQRQGIFDSAFTVRELARELVAYEVPHQQPVESLGTMLMTSGITIDSPPRSPRPWMPTKQARGTSGTS